MCNSTDHVKAWYVPQGANKGWNLQHCLVAGGPGHYPVLSADYNTQPTFAFDITNVPGVTFDSTAPVWAQVGTSKPTSLQVGVLSGIQGGGTRTLSFKDNNNTNNGNPVTVTYVLRFSDGTYTDPIIQNGGCCHVSNSILPTNTSTFIVELAIALLIGVLITFLVQRFRRSGNSSRTGS